MTNETKVTVGIILVTIGIVAGLVWWGGGSTAQSDLPDELKDAVAANSGDYLTGDLVNEGDYVNGLESAPVTLVEFSDFECPFCKETHPVVRDLRSQFGEDQLRIVFRHLPIVEIHNQAYPAARAAVAATRQGKFEEYAALVFENAKSLNDEALISFAEDLGLDVEQFNADRNSDEVAWQAYRARELFKKNGWKVSTPTLVINGELYTGDRSAEALAAAIEAAGANPIAQ